MPAIRSLRPTIAKSPIFRRFNTRKRFRTERGPTRNLLEKNPSYSKTNSLMSRKNKPERLVESVAQQNKIVGRSIDSIVENIASQPGAESRSDWNEICITAELVLVQDLLLGDADQGLRNQAGKVHGHKNSNESKSKTNNNG